MAVEQKCIVSPMLSVRASDPCYARLAPRALSMAAARLRGACSFLLFGFLLCLAGSAGAAIKQCERLTPEQQMQADFCEARVACRVAIALLATCDDATAALRSFHDALSAPDAQRPEPAGVDAQGGQWPGAQPTQARKLTGKPRERDESGQIEAEDRMLQSAMQSTPMRSDDKRVITVVSTDGTSTDGTSAAAPKTDDAALSNLPAAAVAARPARAVDALFKEAISSADAEAKERAQRVANQRAAAAVAAETTLSSGTARTAQEQADAQSMLSDSVGMVFALADRLESEHQFDTARKAFRTLIARFPDHALAAAAAARLSAMRAPPDTLAINPARLDSAAGLDSCDAKLAEFDAELVRLNEHRPANASSMSMLQTVMYMASKSLALGKGVCSGDRREDELTQGMQAALDGARRACANLSASAGECVARAPTW